MEIEAVAFFTALKVLSGFSLMATPPIQQLKMPSICWLYLCVSTSTAACAGDNVACSFNNACCSVWALMISLLTSIKLVDHLVHAAAMACRWFHLAPRSLGVPSAPSTSPSSDGVPALGVRAGACQFCVLLLCVGSVHCFCFCVSYMSLLRKHPARKLDAQLIS